MACRAAETALRPPETATPDLWYCGRGFIGTLSALRIAAHCSPFEVEDTMRFILRLLITAASLWAAVYFVNGISYEGPWYGLLAVAIIFGLVNAIIRPILAALTCPLVMLTLGLFVFVLNGIMLSITSAKSSATKKKKT
jgi:uncharacterized membrane protein YvlD (DUF360 family)